ncbi:hypothetical protein QBC35DRAFT_455669 [Podospora australis]|uniref:Uncharacterized protein n=1 Tax=Podospora australis TaxID=1536484 RepID=A0AAN7AD07_9PEZI|nr:hypothetical protein QBC35DRAFT_455669 [Podospora australis]
MHEDLAQVTHPNPVLASPNPAAILHSESDPVRGYHVCTAYLPLETPRTSPALTPKRLVEAARYEFREWSSSIKRQAAFTAINTSDLVDQLGALNVLVAASPLLAGGPDSCLYTDVLVKHWRNASDREFIDKILGGNLPTMALLLGLSPPGPFSSRVLDTHHSRMHWGSDDD